MSYGVDYAPLGGGCEGLLANPFAAIAALPVDASGTSSFAAPIPDLPFLQGLGLVLQATVPDSAGPLFDVLSLSNGLQLVLGS